MVELCLMASAARAPPAVFSHDQSLGRASKEYHSLIPFQSKRQEIPKNSSLHILPDYGAVQMAKNPVLIDVKDSRPDSVLFSFGIAEQCTRHEKILNYLMSGSNLTTEGPNFSLMSDLMGFQTLSIDPNHEPYFPDDDFCLYEIGSNEPRRSLNPRMQQSVPNSLLDFVGNMLRDSLLSIDENGRILFSGSGAEMKDLASIFAEFNLNKRSPAGSKISLIVPYFDRSRGRGRVGNQVSVLNLQTETISPLKSHETFKTKTTPKKKEKKNSARERDLYQNNHFHTCETLLSLLLNKSKTHSTVLSLKKSGPEIANLLTQFSIGIAGTGLAILFSIALRTAGTWAPLSVARLLNTGFGFGLFWLSCAVNGLRDSVMNVFKSSSNKMKMKDEEIELRVERSMREVLFRAGALMALAVLRFA